MIICFAFHFAVLAVCFICAKNIFTSILTLALLPTSPFAHRPPNFRKMLTAEYTSELLVVDRFSVRSSPLQLRTPEVKLNCVDGKKVIRNERANYAESVTDHYYYYYY